MNTPKLMYMLPSETTQACNFIFISFLLCEITSSKRTVTTDFMYHQEYSIK